MSKIETRAVIVKTDGKQALVRAESADGCEHCAGKGCGIGNLSRMFCSKPRQFKVNNPIDARVGDEVIVSVAEGAVLRGVSLVYVMPLVLLLAGAVLGNLSSQPGQSDGFAAAGALLGLILGYATVKWSSSRHGESRYQPFVARLAQGEVDHDGGSRIAT